MRLWVVALAAVVVLLSVGTVSADMSSGIAHVRDVIVDFWSNLWSGAPDSLLETAPDGSRTMGLRSIEDSGSGSTNVPCGVFGWLNDSIPSNATIDTYKNASIVTVESTLNWDAVTSGTWNTYKASVKYCSDESLRAGLRMSCGGDYGSSSYIATVTDNITSYLPDLTAAPYLATMQFIVVNFTNTTSPDKATFVNAVAQNISEQTGNNFEIMVVESVSGLDPVWVAESAVQYKQLTTKLNWIDWEATTLRGNTTKSRIYSSNESLLDNVSDYQYNILTKMRDSHNTSDQYSETDSVKVLGGDLILYNNGTAAPNTVASPAAGYYWDIHNDTLCNNTVSFYVDDFTYIIREDSFEKIVMASGNASALWASPAYAEALTHLSNGNANNNWVWTTANSDVKVELWDPTYVKSNAFMLHYEWVTTAPISDYSQYEYIIIADNDSTRLSNNIGRPNNTYGYLTVGDYANTDAWLTGKKASVDHWTDTCNVNLFLDEVDLGSAGANFSNRFKVLVDYIRDDKGKKVIPNIYTEYVTYSTYGDATLKESCFATWSGNVYTPTYSYGDISLDAARASFYAEHNVSILGVSFGAVDDYDKMAYCAAAFAVVYGFDGDNYFRYSQPTFQTQYNINLYDYGAMLEGAFTETSSSDWNRLYAAGRVHIDPVNHTWYIEDEKVTSNMSVSVTMYSGGVGSGDRNVYVYVNGNTSHGTIPYNAGVDPLFTWVERTAYLNTTADHVDHGHYWMYGYTRPPSGGWTYLGRHDASTFNPGLCSWFDTTTANIPATVTGQTWTYLARDINWMFNLSVNYTTTREVDELTDRITQSTVRTQTASTNDYVTTIIGVRDTAIPVWSTEVTCGVGGDSFVKNATDTYIALNAGGVGWNYTTVDGKQYGVLATAGGYQYMTPHASTHVFKTTVDIAPPPTPVNLANTTGNFWVNHAWQAGSGNTTDSYNVNVNDTWHNGTTITFWNNTPLSPHGWSNISVYAFNATDGGSFSTGSASQDTQVPNNAITITNVSDAEDLEGMSIFVDCDATDADSDTPVFSCNRTDLFTDFDTVTGKGNWTMVAGSYNVDFGVADGYGSTNNTTINILVNVAPTPPDPAGIANTTSNFWVTHTWGAGAGNVTDSFNVSVNDTWHNATTNTFWNNTPLSPHGWSNITVYAYNTSGVGTLSTGNASQDSQIPNNPITITNTSDWTGWLDEPVYVDYDATDVDSDAPTFSCNRTDLFTDFSTASGKGNWTSAVGTYYVDFGVSDGYGSTDNYTMTIAVGALPYLPPDPTTLANTTGNFWVNHTWSAGAGNVTDSFNVSVNDTWHNGTTNTFWNNTPLSPHGWSNITVYAFNASNWGALSALCTSQNTQIPNNPITITNTSDWSGIIGEIVYVDYDATDADSDTPTFSCNRTDLFTDFNTATGIGNWVSTAGVYYVDFGVSDGYGSTDNYTMTLVSGTSRPADPDIFHSETGNFWVLHSWGSGRHFIMGADEGAFHGYNWTGTAWQSDSGITSGLSGIQAYSAPALFQTGDGRWYMISGRCAWLFATKYNSFRGFNWTGSAWQSDTGIVDGLADTVDSELRNYMPATFQKHGVRYLISGQYSGTFFGYNWNGSTWQSDSGITSGLGDVGGWSAPTVFELDGTWYLISGVEDGGFYGFNWTGLTWQSDSGITSGLGDVGSWSAPTVFRNNGAWYLVSGELSGGYYGFNWTGTAWQSDSGITSGLASVPGHARSAPSSMVLPPPTAGIHGVIDSYNVSINGIWHNTTTDALWNDTGAAPHGWSNITVYAYNASGDGNLSSTGSSLNTRISNNPCTITNITDMAGRAGIDELYVDCNLNDIDYTDVPTFSCNRTDLFTDFNTATGTGHCMTPYGCVDVDFGVSDGWGSTSNRTTQISDLNRWWNNSWDCRQRITINNTQPEDLDNTYVAVIVSASQCYWSDCSDMRMVDAWTHEEVDYYCDADIGGFPGNTTSEKIYLKVPHIPGNGTVFVDFYFGHINSTPNKCLGSGTLSFTENFEEFADGDPFLDNWDFSGAAGTGGYEFPGGGWCFKGNTTSTHAGCTVPCANCNNFYPPNHYRVNAYLMYGYYGDRLVLVQPTGATISFDFYAPTRYNSWGTPANGSVILFGCDGGSPTLYHRDFWDSETYTDTVSGWGNGVPHADRLNIELARWTGYVWTWNNDLPCIDNIVFQQDDPYMPTHTVGDGETQSGLSYAILYDVNQNLVQHAQATIQNTATGAITERWKDIDNGIITFSSPGTFQIAVRTFDGVFVRTVTVSELQTANITIPINYNVDIHPEDQTGTPLTDVFCGLSEYTPLNPQSLWGFSMGGRQYVPITNCSGFAMCDIYAEKGGYDDYEATAINWTSRSAMVKDYRHDVVLQKE